MQVTLVVVLVGITSLGGYLVGVRCFGLSATTFPVAIGRMLECIGATVIFLVVNVAVGIVAILAARAVTADFVSLYPAADLTLLPLSLLQGLAFRWWQESHPR